MIEQALNLTSQDGIRLLHNGTGRIRLRDKAKKWIIINIRSGGIFNDNN